MGADKAIHIFAENYEKMDAWVTAMVLAHSVRTFQFDLILCGREAADNQNSLVGPYIAEQLKIPCLSSVINLEMDRANEILLVQRLLERGNREIIECRVPALVAVAKGMNIPRYPTLPGILKAQHQMIEKLEIEHFGLSMDQIGSASNLTETIRLSSPKPKSKAPSSEDRKPSAADRLSLLTKSADPKKKRSSKLLEGISENILDELERLFKEHGIISE
jgi:electron transfer flavoprotein beta subunit